MKTYDSMGQATGEAMRRNAERAAELAAITNAERGETGDDSAPTSRP